MVLPKDWYKKEVEQEGLFGSGICEVCGKPGYHDACKEKVEVAIAARDKEDKLLLNKYSISGSNGVDGPNTILSYKEACEVLKQYVGDKLNAEDSEAIESKSWWYISHTWIGCVGYIVEKESKKVFCLGSGWAGIDKENICSAHWSGIKAYLDGKISYEEKS